MNKFNWQLLKSRNFRLRVLSALILAPIAIGIVLYGGALYNIAVLAIALLGLHEWLTMFGKPKLLQRPRIWLYGLLYMGGFAAAMLTLRLAPNANRVLYVLIVVWATDIGAYIVGRAVGGPKLAPTISPNKTWAGLLGGMSCAALCGYLFITYQGYFLSGTHLWVVAGFAAFLALVAQMGDLFESAAKRHAGVKDSGSLIPGHGGVLDRIDGLVFAAILAALMSHISAPQY